MTALASASIARINGAGIVVITVVSLCQAWPKCSLANGIIAGIKGVGAHNSSQLVAACHIIGADIAIIAISFRRNRGMLAHGGINVAAIIGAVVEVSTITSNIAAGGKTVNYSANGFGKIARVIGDIQTERNGLIVAICGGYACSVLADFCVGITAARVAENAIRFFGLQTSAALA